MTDNEFYAVLNRCMPEYRIIEVIGSGKFGSVYKCERDGIYYAIKVVPVPANEQELQTLLARSEKEEVEAYLKEKVEKYRKEIMMMAELKGNRSIVNIEDYKVIQGDNGIWYVVIRMELLVSLPKYATRNPLTEKDVINLGIDMCDALVICEKHDIIHRDIKPENIMHHSEGAYKLGDFGVAKQLSKTTAGTIAGTEGFMAPEVYKGQEYNHTADIYSLGIVLYYYLNNKKMPFVAPNNKSLIAEQEAIERRMVDSTILPPPPNASESLSKIIVKASMFDKNCRYQSAADMRADLKKVLNGEKVEVDLSPVQERGTVVQVSALKQKNDNKSDTPFSGDIVDDTASKRRLSRERKSTEEFTKTKKKKSKKGAFIAIAAVCVLAIGAGGAAFFLKHSKDLAPGTYYDENGEEIVVLSKEEMQAAYDLGVQYYEEGKYEEAIEELNKVTDRSKVYDEAQTALENTINGYRGSLIEKSQEFSANKDYDSAFSMIDTGIAALGDSKEFQDAKSAVIEALKVDYIARADEQEKAESYEKALEYVNTAMVYLPDDYELKGMQSRLAASNTAQKAIAKAEEYKYKLDYAKLFPALEKAMEEVADNTSAYGKVKLAYDGYMSEYKEMLETETTDLETYDDYDRAVSLLESAVLIFPDDYKLKTQLDETKDMRTAVKALSDAENYSNKGDYASLFKALNKALDTLSVGSDAAKKVMSTYDKYEKSYIESLYEHIGEPQTIQEYENSIALLENAIVVLPDVYDLTNKLEQLRKTIPVDLFSMSLVDTKRYDDTSDVYEINLESDVYLKYHQRLNDNFGNTYDDAVVMTVIDYSAGQAYRRDCYTVYITYDCMEYNMLRGTVAIADTSKSYTGDMEIEISGYTDNMKENIIYELNLPTISRPQQIEVDCSNYSLIKISLVCNNKGEYGKPGSVILSDFTLSK